MTLENLSKGEQIMSKISGSQATMIARVVFVYQADRARL